MLRELLICTSHNIIIEAVKRHGLEDNLLVYQVRAVHQENHTHTCRKNSGGVCGQGLSAAGCFIFPDVQPGWSKLMNRLSEKGCHTMGYADPQKQQFSADYLRASSGNSDYGTAVV
jgi:hypothetical protein